MAAFDVSILLITELLLYNSTMIKIHRWTLHDMLKSRELAEQMTGWQSNHHIIMACILEDLKSWGGFDATCVPVGTKLRTLHYWSPAGNRCKNRKRSAWPSPSKGRVWAACCQSHDCWNCFNGNKLCGNFGDLIALITILVDWYQVTCLLTLRPHLPEITVLVDWA